MNLTIPLILVFLFNSLGLAQAFQPNVTVVTVNGGVSTITLSTEVCFENKCPQSTLGAVSKGSTSSDRYSSTKTYRVTRFTTSSVCPKCITSSLTSDSSTNSSTSTSIPSTTSSSVISTSSNSIISSSEPPSSVTYGYSTITTTIKGVVTEYVTWCPLTKTSTHSRLTSSRTITKTSTVTGSSKQLTTVTSSSKKTSNTTPTSTPNGPEYVLSTITTTTEGVVTMFTTWCPLTSSVPERTMIEASTSSYYTSRSSSSKRNHSTTDRASTSTTKKESQSTTLKSSAIITLSTKKTTTTTKSTQKTHITTPSRLVTTTLSNGPVIEISTKKTSTTNTLRSTVICTGEDCVRHDTTLAAHSSVSPIGSQPDRHNKVSSGTLVTGKRSSQSQITTSLIEIPSSTTNIIVTSTPTPNTAYQSVYSSLITTSSTPVLEYQGAGNIVLPVSTLVLLTIVIGVLVF